MKTLIEKSKALVHIAVVSSVLAAAAAFLWGMVKTILVITEMATDIRGTAAATIGLVEVMDIFLIATVLFIFGLGMYELFLGQINLPEWLVIRNLHDLKVKLSSVIILVMAIKFLEHLVEWKDPTGTLFFGIAVGIVAGALIAFNTLCGHNE